MGALIALGTVLGIIVAGGTIWTWIWPLIKRYRDERQAGRLRAALEKGKLDATLADFSTRIATLEETVDKIEVEQSAVVESIKTLNEYVGTVPDAINILLDSDERTRMDVSALKVKVDAQGDRLAKIATGFWSTPKPSNG